jgi:hypothetical protein
MNRFAVLALVVLLPGCATVLKGTNDTVALDTMPAGANCTVDRNGERVGEVAATPGTVRLSKSRHELHVTCAREGYQTAQAVAHPRFNGATFFNILLGGIPGFLVDAVSGANNTYPPQVRVGMAENPAAQPPAPIAATPAPVLRPAAHQQLRGPGM